MNILRHKKWHVRTKENVARVRRDEAKAAEEEKQKSERALIAENEDRVRRLKSKATSKNMDNIFGKVPDGVGSSSSITEIQTGHVNLFAELEDQERKNLTVGNKEYAAEKKKEQDDWESKVGMRPD
jgi:ketol-acid reductoisomerase